MSFLLDAVQNVDHAQSLELTGTVARVSGLTLRVDDLALPVGAMVRVDSDYTSVEGEVVGFDEDQTLVMLLGDTAGIRRGDRVTGTQAWPVARVGHGLIGRVIDAMGRPIDGKGPIHETVGRPLRPRPVDPMRRVPIDKPLGTGVRAIDAMEPVGRGQRLGIFSGPGVGKSTLLGMIARQTQADVSVVALIGERGREVQDFVKHVLGSEGMARTVVVVATGDEPALVRIRAALMATSVAEFFRQEGMDAMLLMDSVTRFCQALRQVGLAAGEPPATKGYPPSVFAALPSLLERTGRTEAGSITGFYTVLVEGDDLSDPIADASRAILDGHVVLDRELADRGQWPAIDVSASISRVAVDVIDEAHQAARLSIGSLISAWREVEDLVNIGAYARGSNPRFDTAIAMRDLIESLLRQRPNEAMTFEQARAELLALAERARLAGRGSGGRAA